MRPTIVVLWALIAVAAGCFTAMWLWTIPVIQVGSGGAPLLDFIDTDTPVADVRHYLDTLKPAARDMYLGPQRVLDTVFPVALAGALALLTVLLLRPKVGRIGLVAALVPLLYLYVDLLENVAIAGLLRAEAPTAEAIELAMVYTEMKFLLLLIVGLVLTLALFSSLVAWSIARIGGGS